GVPIKTDIYERGLHARKHTADAAVIDAACQPDAGIPFVVHLNQFVVFEHGDLRLVRRRGNGLLLWHGNSSSGRKVGRIDPDGRPGFAMYYPLLAVGP